MSELEFEFREAGEFVEIEDGMYEATLKEVQLFDTQYGKSLRWIFEVETEDGDIVEVNGITSAKFSSKSKAYAWFTALGGKVKNGKVYIEDVIDNECLVQIENRVGKDGETKFPNVVDVKPPMRKRKKSSSKKKKREEEIEEVETEDYDLSSDEKFDKEEEEKETEEEEEEEEEEESEKKSSRSRNKSKSKK